MAEECARGERRGWGEFVCDYAAISRLLLSQYFPVITPEMDIHVASVFERARAADNGWFATLKFSNEREFLMAFRELVFAYGREAARVPAPEMSLEQLREVMKDLNVVEREILWLYVKGFTADRIAPIMANLAATAEAVKRIADERLQQVLPGASADAFNVSARVLIEAAEKTQGDKCLPLKTINNMINGQVTWRERELAEEHIKDCFYCIDRLTSFNEMIRFRKEARPPPQQEIDAILAQLNLPKAKGKGVLGRLFARG